MWSTVTRELVARRPKVLDEGLAWFPGGKRLAFTALVERGAADALRKSHVPDGDVFASATRAWPREPVVHVLDLDTGEATALHVGERAIVSPDGERLLVRDFENHWRVLDLAANTSRPFEAPGALYPGAIAFASDDVVLYWALPTEGAELRTTENNSPLVGKKPMRTLKLVDLRDGRFQTVLPYVDPRRAVSFGPGVPRRSRRRARA